MYTYIFSIFLLSCVLKAQEQELTCSPCRDDPAIEQSQLEFEINMYLCTRNENNCKQIDFSKNLKEFLREQHFNPKSNTTIIAHGFTQDHRAKWIQEITKYLLLWDPTMNVMLVDWSKAYSSTWSILQHFENQWGIPLSFDYRRAALGTKTVAMKIKDYLEAIGNASEKLSQWKHVHFIGYSLGAHVVGQAARNLKNNLLVHRVTALDPAFPCFENKSASLRIKKKDAKFIDVIHTNSGQGMKTLGIHEPIGHIDFYPNGGNSQPFIRNPKTINFSEIKNLLPNPKAPFCDHFGTPVKDVAKYIFRKLNSHSAAPDYFINSLKGTEYLSNKIDFTHPTLVVNDTIKRENKRCTINTCVEMGINAEKYQNTGHRTYYVQII